ncbi:MAG: heparan-alpha-glucosaminide N-acetyltransferase domain-containing protein [Candidatus Aminicenantaceae bacterium]
MTQNAIKNEGKRLLPLDALRGLILLFMALDHANFFVARMHPTGEFWGIPLPSYESLWAFLTRVLTHLCAPGFFFLLGIGMVLFTQSRTRLGWSRVRITRFFLKRGVLLILLQFFVENPCWLMGPAGMEPPGSKDQIWIHFGVLSALGAAMILGALLLHLKWGIVLGLSAAALILTWVVIPDPSRAEYLFSPLVRILMIPGRTGMLQVFYSIVPWAGIAGLGMVFGRRLSSDADRAYRSAALTGLVFLLMFPALRLLGSFGSIHPYEGGGLIAFFNVTKYPPSAVFLLLTLGACLLVLWMFSRAGPCLRHWAKPLLVYGRTPLFFYLAHLYLYALVGLFTASRVEGSLPFMYVVWLAGIVILYPGCLWYGRFKASTPPDSIWRLF